MGLVAVCVQVDVYPPVKVGVKELVKQYVQVHVLPLARAVVRGAAVPVEPVLITIKTSGVPHEFVRDTFNTCSLAHIS